MRRNRMTAWALYKCTDRTNGQRQPHGDRVCGRILLTNKTDKKDQLCEWGKMRQNQMQKQNAPGRKGEKSFVWARTNRASSRVHVQSEKETKAKKCIIRYRQPPKRRTAMWCNVVIATFVNSIQRSEVEQRRWKENTCQSTKSIWKWNEKSIEVHSCSNNNETKPKRNYVRDSLMSASDKPRRPKPSEERRNRSSGKRGNERWQVNYRATATVYARARGACKVHVCW